VNELKGDELLKFESVQNWISSLDQMAVQRGKDGLTKNAKAMRLGRMWEYTLEGKLNPDELLQEAKDNIDDAGKRLKAYFAKKKLKTSHNTAVTSVGFVRGFYTHNDVLFPKRWGVPRAKVAKVSKSDEATGFYKYNAEKDKVEFQNGNMQHFIQNLNFRDQTIALCLLSTGADATDLFKLKVGFVKDGRGKITDAKRIFWHGNRAKTGKPFKTFFSKEATRFLKRYVDQERADAKDDDYLFPKTNDKPMDAHQLSMNFKEAAKKMGYTEDNRLSPFRPKRFRHLFRTACAIAEIDEGYAKAMMGHSLDISGGYLEKDSSIFEKLYVKLEPYITVYASGEYEVNTISKEHRLLKDDFAKMTQRNLKLEADVKRMDTEVKDLKEQLKQATDMIYSFEPVLETFSAIADTEEGQELIRKVQVPSDKESAQFEAEVTKGQKSE